MNDAVPEPRTFYTQKIPSQFNRALQEQPRKSEEERRVLASLEAVNATLSVEVQGEGGGTFHLNIESGRMTAGDTANHPPFLTLIQDRPAFERMAREAGDSAMAMLGGLSGLAGEMKLTQARIDALAALRGTVRFTVTGDSGFSLITHFGDDPVPEEPTASITVDEDAYRALRAGELEPAQAFMDAKIDVQGDINLTMQLALAAISPD